MKALIIGTLGNEDHEAKVRDAFVLGYNESGGNITSADVEVQSTAFLDLQSGFDYCKTNNIKILVCSYQGAGGFINIAKANIEDTTLCMPTGANEEGEIFSGTMPQPLVFTGAGDVANETADNVEFISHDPIESDEQDYSSYSNGYIAGQILYISEQRNCSIWEARYCARMTGSEGGVFHEVNGFGRINTADAIAYSGFIPDNPFVTPPVTQIFHDNLYKKRPDRQDVLVKVRTDGVFIQFGSDFDGLSKVIYRKTANQDYQEIATTLTDYKDYSITREPSKQTYKIIINEIEHFISTLFCKITSTYTK